MNLGAQTVNVINDTDGALGKFGPAVVAGSPVTVTGCAFQQHETDRRDTGLTDVSTARYKLFAPASAPLTSTSHVVVGSVTYDVDGIPTPWTDLSGRVSHIECYLKQRQA